MSDTVNMPTSSPSNKVVAATAAAAATTFVLWVLSEYVFKGDVPEPVQGLIALAVPAIFTFIAGYVVRRSSVEAAGGQHVA